MLIELTQGKFAKVSDHRYSKLIQYSWCAQKIKSRWYAVAYLGKINGKYTNIFMHNFIMRDADYLVDHIDGDGLNNQDENLRYCNQSQNNMNSRKRKNTSSKYKGVCSYKAYKKWQTRIVVNKKVINIGYFSDEVVAAKEYDKAAIKYFGDFARTNF